MDRQTIDRSFRENHFLIMNEKINDFKKLTTFSIVVLASQLTSEFFERNDRLNSSILQSLTNDERTIEKSETHLSIPESHSPWQKNLFKPLVLLDYSLKGVTGNVWWLN